MPMASQRYVAVSWLRDEHAGVRLICTLCQLWHWWGDRTKSIVPLRWLSSYEAAWQGELKVRDIWNVRADWLTTDKESLCLLPEGRTGKLRKSHKSWRNIVFLLHISPHLWVLKKQHVPAVSAVNFLAAHSTCPRGKLAIRRLGWNRIKISSPPHTFFVKKLVSTGIIVMRDARLLKELF